MAGWPPLDGATAIDYRGARFALGRTADAYGIWDLPAGGGPVLTFPLSHEGWAEAWRTYRYWEETAELPAAPGQPAPAQQQPAPARPVMPGPGPAGAGQAGTLVTGPLTFANTVEFAARIYGRHAAKLIPLVGVVIIPLSLIQTAVIESVLGSYARFVERGVAPLEVVQDILPRFLLVVLGIAVAGFVVNGFLTAAVTGAAVDAAGGRDVSVGRSLRVALTRLHSVLWIALLQTLLVLVALIVPGAVIVAGAAVESAALVVLGTVLALIPVFFVVIRLLFSIPVLMAEGLRGWSAVRRSWALVADRWWRTFGIFLLVVLVAGLVGLLFQSIAQALSPRTVGVTGPAAYIGALGSGIASSLTTPFVILVIVLLYLDARFRTEGGVGMPPRGPGG